jgi:hypothetical protein
MINLKPTDFSTQTLFNHLITEYIEDKNLELAIALHRCLKWELVAVEQDEEIKKAAVRHPDGGVYDARGHISDEEFLFGYDNGVIISFKFETDLSFKTRHIVERDIFEAGKLAMSMWPTLPWYKDAYIVHIMNFMKDLQKVSKHHGFWIEDSVNTITPDGNCYELYITGNGEYRVKLSKE